MNAYLERTSDSQFLELVVNDNTLVLRRGIIDRACLVLSLTLKKETCEDVFAQVKNQFVKDGYIEQTPESDIIEGCHAIAIHSDDIREHPVYGEFFKIGNVDYYIKEDGGTYVWHFHDGLRYGGDLDLADISNLGIAGGLIIEGDVTVDGIFSQDEYEYPLGTLILGNVFAKSLVHADSHVVIKGSVHVEQTVYGYYNNGSLEISGNVSGEAFVSYDHNMWAGGEYRLFTAYDDYSEADWLNPKLKDFNDGANFSAVGDFVHAGKSILRKGLRYEQELFESEERLASEEPAADQKSINAGETTEQDTAAAVEFDPKLLKALEGFSMANDNMGLTQTLLDWPDRDRGWEILVQTRLGAPSCSDEEKELLSKVLPDFTSTEDEPNLESELPEHGPANDDMATSSTGITGFLKKVADGFEQESENETESKFTRVKLDKASHKTMKKLGKEVEKLNQRASDLQTSNSEKALPIFTNVIDLCRPYLNIDSDLQEFWEHDYVHAMQGRLWCLNDLVEKGQTELQVQAERLANDIIELDQSDVFYYSSLGDVLRVAVVLAHNTLAWYGYLRAKQLKEQNDPQAATLLQDALEHCSEALEDADYCGEETLLVVLENKALILFLLDRPDDAHLITYQVLNQLEVDSHPYFDDIAQSEGYKIWDEAT